MNKSLFDACVKELKEVLKEYKSLGLRNAPDYGEKWLCSMVTHTAALEGSTITEEENLPCMKTRNWTLPKHSDMFVWQSITLYSTYSHGISQALEHNAFNTASLKKSARDIMQYLYLLRHTNDPSYRECDLPDIMPCDKMNYEDAEWLETHNILNNFCNEVNEQREILLESHDVIEQYLMTFDAHFLLWTSHLWYEVKGFICRYVMHLLQVEYGLVPTVIKKERKQRYIESLKDSIRQRSVEPFWIFMLKEHTRNLRYEIDDFKMGHKLEPKFMMLYEAVKEDGTCNYAQYAEQLCISEATIKRRLNELKRSGYIKRVGSNKTGHWEVL